MNTADTWCAKGANLDGLGTTVPTCYGPRADAVVFWAGVTGLTGAECQWLYEELAHYAPSHEVQLKAAGMLTRRHVPR